MTARPPLCGLAWLGAAFLALTVFGLLGLTRLLRARYKGAWAGATLTGAVLTKLFALVAAPAFRRGGRFSRPTPAGLVVIGGGYVDHPRAGRHVLGLLPSYGQQEGTDAGLGIWLPTGPAQLVLLPPGRPGGLRRPRCTELSRSRRRVSSPARA